MKEIQKLVLLNILADLKLAKAKVEYNSDYVFGFDDVVIVINREIDKLK